MGELQGVFDAVESAGEGHAALVGDEADAAHRAHAQTGVGQDLAGGLESDGLDGFEPESDVADPGKAGCFGGLG